MKLRTRPLKGSVHANTSNYMHACIHTCVQIKAAHARESADRAVERAQNIILSMGSAPARWMHWDEAIMGDAVWDE